MKKTYIIPRVDVMAILAVNVIANSLGTNESGADGNGQLSKKDNDWNIWDDGVEY